VFARRSDALAFAAASCSWRDGFRGLRLRRGRRGPKSLRAVPAWSRRAPGRRTSGIAALSTAWRRGLARLRALEATRKILTTAAHGTRH
jgi:hypothetical protein